MKAMRGCGVQIVCAVAVLTAVRPTAQAASATWTGAANALWADNANWSASPYPGSAAADSATFDGAGSGNTTIDLLGLGSILNISFSSSGVAAYTLGAGGANAQELVLESGGLLAVASTAGHDQTVAATLRLGPTRAGGTYTLRNSSPLQTLTFSGDIAGVAAGGTAGAKTLVLDGVGSIGLAGMLANGGASALALHSYGTSTLAGSNTFSGNVTVYDGTLRLTHSHALGSGTKTASANNNISGRNPSFVLDGSAGALTLPANVTFNTSNQRAGAVINAAGNNTILGNFTLTSGDGATHIWSLADTLTIAGNMTPNTTGRSLHFRGDGDIEVSGVIANGSTTTGLPVYRESGGGTLTLSGANTYSGQTLVNAGTLTVAGAAGTIASSPTVTLAANTTLRVLNTPSSNHGDRLHNTGAITLNNATLEFAHAGGGASYSETAGTLSVSGPFNTLATSQADAGQTSTLTLAALARTGDATLDFTGAGLGASDRNRILILGQPDGPIGSWATVNRSAPALYSSTRGVYADVTADIAAKGDTISHAPASDVRIVSAGTSGPNALSGTETVIRSLTQDSAFASVIDTAGKTLRVDSVFLADGRADLTLGVAARDGTVTPQADGGALALANHSAASLTVHANLADQTLPSSLLKTGTGDARLAGTNTLSGRVTIYQGTLTLAESLALQNATLTTAGLCFDSAVPESAFSLGNLTNAFPLALTDTADNPVALTVGAPGGSSAFGGGLSGAGSLTKSGSGTLTLSGANAHSGGTTVSAGRVIASQNAALGVGPVVNQATLDLTAGGVTYTGLDLSLAGAGTLNVKLGTGTATTVLDGDYSAFTGVWNLGLNAAAAAGKARMSGLDHAAATVHVGTNATLYMHQPVVKNAAAYLHGGDTGEALGQLRLDGLSEWAGPVFLAGEMTGSGDGFFGSNSGYTGLVSGVVADLAAPYPVHKVGGGRVFFTGTNNTFAGSFWIRGGSVGAASIRNVGQPSSLGQPANAADAAIRIGAGTSAARLIYLGEGDTTDRAIDLAGTTATAILEQAGTGHLTFTSDLLYSGQGNKTLQLDGGTEGTAELAGVFADSGGFTHSLTKLGSGTWSLAAANQHTGETRIQGGTLTLKHPQAVATSSRVRVETRDPAGVLELAHDGVDEMLPIVTVGVGFRATLVSGAAADDTGINHDIGIFDVSLATVNVARASGIVNGTPAITAGTVNLSGGGAYTTLFNPTTADLYLGNVSINANSHAKTLQLDGTSERSRVDGVITNGINTLSVRKSNSGTWRLRGANTYTGATGVEGGTLVLDGADGAIGNSARVTVDADAALLLDNTSDVNANRLGDTVPVTLNGGLLAYSHAGGAADYGETIGAVSVAGGTNTLAAAQADSGQESTLTLASLARTGSGSLDFSSAGLGDDARSRILISNQPDGLVGFWATYNGGGLALYDSTRGVYSADELAATEIAARGPSSVIPDDAAAAVRITTAGTSGSIELAETETRVALLRQTTDTDAVVDTAAKTLRAHGIAIDDGQADLTLGVNVGDGTLTSLTPGGSLSLGNASENTLTVNAALADNASASALDVSGPGAVVLAAPVAHTGATTVNNGTLTLASDAAQTLTGPLHGNGTWLKSGTNLLHLLSPDSTFTGPFLIQKGLVRADQDSTFGASGGGVFVADGATLDVGCTPDVDGTRSNNALNMGNEIITVQGPGVNGIGALVNLSTGQQYHAAQHVALAGDARFGGTARFDTRGSLTLNDHTLTKVGNSYYMIAGAIVNPGGGHIDVAAGVLRIESAAKLNGSAANTLTVRSGAEIESYRVTTPVLWSLIFENASTFDAAYSSTASSHNRWDGPLSVNGALTLTGGDSAQVADIRGLISGSGPITKTGNAVITLSNTNSTFSVAPRLHAGTLSVPRLGSVSEPSPLGQQATPAAAALQFSGGTLRYTGPGETSDRPLDIYATGNATLNHSGSGLLTLTASLLFSGSGARTFTLRGASLEGGVFAGNLADGGGTLNLTKLDAGNWTLSNTNTFTGTLTVNGGTLTLAGTNHYGTGTIRVAEAAGNGTLRMVEGSSLGGTSAGTGNGNFTVGRTSGAHGAFFMTGGSLHRAASTGTDNAFGFGIAANSYGYFRQDGGTLQNTRLQVGASSGTTANMGYGVGRITGGFTRIPEYIIIGRNTNSVGVLTVDGGTINHASASQNIALGWGGGRGELNLTGGHLDNSGRSIAVHQQNSTGNGGTGIVNVCAGTLINDAFSNAANRYLFLSFAGGTLQAGSVDSALFVPASVSAVTVFGAYGAFAGGATIDTASRAVTVAAPVRAPAGQGVYAITLATPGSGYIGEPYVEIRGGGGVGATAVANLEDDASGNGTYRIASVTITCPGTGYAESPTVAFLRGGSAAVAPTVAAVTLAANASGGLTKAGEGTLTLGAANTYTGATAVAGGTLRLGHAAALPTGSAVVLAGGTLDLNGYTVTNAVSGAGTLANGTLHTVLSPAGEGTVGTENLSLASMSLTGTYLADVTSGGACDLVDVTGDINLNGLVVHIVDASQLARQKRYTVLSATGTLSGKPTLTGLSDARWKLVPFADGTLRLLFVDGTVIRLR